MIEANSTRPARADPRGDADLARAAREDPDAFVALYDRHMMSVYRLCLSRLRQREAAEDATSEVFLKALEGIHGFRGGSFVAWLMVIARHTVADTARRRTPTQGMVVEPRDPTLTPDESIPRLSDLQELSAALDQLTDEQRSVIELQLAGLRGPAIAEALGKSHDAVKMLRLRAMRRLREALLTRGTSDRETSNG